MWEDHDALAAVDRAQERQAGTRRRAPQPQEPADGPLRRSRRGLLARGVPAPITAQEVTMSSHSRRRTLPLATALLALVLSAPAAPANPQTITRSRVVTPSRRLGRQPRHSFAVR